MSDLLEKLTILIPTKNRPAFVERALSYYAAQQWPGRIIVGDGSSVAEHHVAGNAVVKQVQGRINVNYNHFAPDVTYGSSLLALVQSAATPYVVIIGDDDFLVAKGVRACIACLDSEATVVASLANVSRCASPARQSQAIQNGSIAGSTMQRLWLAAGILSDCAICRRCRGTSTFIASTGATR